MGQYDVSQSFPLPASGLRYGLAYSAPLALQAKTRFRNDKHWRSAQFSCESLITQSSALTVFQRFGSGLAAEPAPSSSRNWRRPLAATASSRKYNDAGAINHTVAVV